MRDITLGQYINGDSALHRLDPRLKLLATVVFIVFLFLIKSPFIMIIMLLALLLLYHMVHIPVKLLLVSVKPVLPIILFTSFLNMFFVKGEPLITLWRFTISDKGVLFAFMLSARIIVLLAGSSLLTYTTTPIQLTSAIESLFTPLLRFGFPVHELAMMMTIALRFIPTLLNETDKIISAQKSRGADMESGNFIQRVKALSPVLIPLFVSAFRRADELALAMECRCYNATEKRTRLHQLKYTRKDAIAAVLCVVFLGVLLFADGKMNVRL